MSGAVEKMAKALCKSGRFENGQGTCAVICMEALGDARSKCAHCVRVHGNLARDLIEAMREPTRAMRRAGMPNYAGSDAEAITRLRWQAMIDAALEEE